MWFFSISIILVIIGIVFLITSFTTSFGVKLGTEFSPGTQLRVAFSQSVAVSDLKAEVINQGYTAATVRQETPISGGQTDYVIRINTGANILSQNEQTTLIDALTARFGTTDVLGSSRWVLRLQAKRCYILLLRW